MILRGCRTIAEYAIRRWMAQQGFAEGYFILQMVGEEGIITDKNGDMLTLVYNHEEKCVYVKEE